MRDKFAYEECFILAATLISLAKSTRSIDHYRRFKAISFLAVKTILARRHVDDRTQNFILFLFPEQTDVHTHQN